MGIQLPIENTEIDQSTIYIPLIPEVGIFSNNISLMKCLFHLKTEKGQKLDDLALISEPRLVRVNTQKNFLPETIASS